MIGLLNGHDMGVIIPGFIMPSHHGAMHTPPFVFALSDCATGLRPLVV